MAQLGPVSVERFAEHLRLDQESVEAEGELLALYLGAATEYVETHTGLKLRGEGVEDGAIPDMARSAILLLAGHWYATREAATPQALTEAPLGIRSLLHLLWEGPQG